VAATDAQRNEREACSGLRLGLRAGLVVDSLGALPCINFILCLLLGFQSVAPQYRHCCLSFQLHVLESLESPPPPEKAQD